MTHHLLQPGRLKQFGAVHLQYDSRRRGITSKAGADLKVNGNNPDSRPKYTKSIKNTEQGGLLEKYQLPVSHLTGTVPESGRGAPKGVPLLDYFNEDYHRDFSTMLGDVAIPR